MSKYVLSCDWGTSAFRLRLAASEELRVIGEVASRDGIAATYDSWKQRHEQKVASRTPEGVGEPAEVMQDRQAFYRSVLKKQISALSGKVSISTDGIPLIISGMASSSIGMTEIPYASMPFPLDGSGVVTRRLPAEEDFLHEILIISGVQNQLDVMRGEETEMLGLADLAEDTAGDPVFIFPGTHSKHLYVRGGAMTDFETFMTGELFHLMRHHSVLKDSVEEADSNDLERSLLNAFRQGVGRSGTSGLLQGLFSVRVNQLFGNLDRKQNFYYLSGLLIGSELRELIKKKPPHLVLCCGSRLSGLYRLAVEELGWLTKTTLVPPERMDKAALAGQVKLYNNLT